MLLIKEINQDMLRDYEIFLILFLFMLEIYAYKKIAEYCARLYNI